MRQCWRTTARLVGHRPPVRALTLFAALLLWPSSATALEVRDHHLRDRGHDVQLRGVNFSGAEYACIQGYGIWDKPTPDAHQIALIRSWGANAVRLPLNEDCWLGLHTRREYGGQNYRAAIARAVDAFHRAGIYTILDLHWSAPGHQPATKLLPLPDADHSPAFWRSVARRFRGDPMMLFDLFNEPFGPTDWRCWKLGCQRGGYRTAGMTQLVRAVRGQGARQPIMLGGFAYANDLSAWPAWIPHDPAHALVASFHLYNFNGCVNVACWDRTLAPIAARYPVVTGELGEDDCAHGFIDRYMAWADRLNISYLGWSWNPVSCGADGPSLISDDQGTPTAYGEGLRRHLQQREGQSGR